MITASPLTIDLGLFTLDDSRPDNRWRATPLVEQFQSYVADPAQSIGILKGEFRSQESEVRRIADS